MKKSAIVAFIYLGVIWGSNFIFVKWAAEFISPLQITLLRVLFGFLPVLIYAVATQALRRDHWRHAHHFLVMSLLATAVYYFAFAKGTALLDTGIAGMLGGAIPLFTFLCAWLFLRSEQINMIKTLGIGVGFAGILLVAKPWSAQGAVNAAGVGYMIFGAFSVGCSFVYAKRFISPLSLPAAALTTYQIGLALILLLIGALRAEPISASSWVAAGLILAGVALVQLHARFRVGKPDALDRSPIKTS